MRYFGRFMLLTLGLGVVAFVLSSLPGHPVVAAAEGPGVTVVNTPLPVNVGNFPSTQAVSGTVNFGNFPSSLGVSNVSGAPLYVRDVDNAAHHPFAAGLSTGLTCTVAPGSGVCNASFSVPSGEELVIETVSIDAFLSPGVQSHWHHRGDHRRHRHGLHASTQLCGHHFRIRPMDRHPTDALVCRPRLDRRGKYLSE